MIDNSKVLKGKEGPPEERKVTTEDGPKLAKLIDTAIVLTRLLEAARKRGESGEYVRKLLKELDEVDVKLRGHLESLRLAS